MLDPPDLLHMKVALGRTLMLLGVGLEDEGQAEEGDEDGVAARTDST